MARRPRSETDDPAAEPDKFVPDSAVNDLHSDPDDFSPQTTLIGYVGPSPNDDNFRLYTDLSFSKFYEIPKDALKGRTSADSSDENAPSIIRIDAGARVRIVTHSESSVEASAIAGNISSGYLSGSVRCGRGALSGFSTDPNVCTTLVCETVSVAFCAQGRGASPRGGFSTDPNVCTTLVCETVSVAFCAQGRGAGPRGAFSTDPNVCTTIACETISLAVCAQGRGAAPRGGFSTDPNVCTTLVCETISLAVCAQGARAAAPQTFDVTIDPNACPPILTNPMICDPVPPSFVPACWSRRR
jgi:hypothetical protein